MTTSGSSDFDLNRDQIITLAALQVNAIGLGETPNSAMMSSFALQLNAMVKSLQASGLHVWTVSEATLFPAASQTKYALATNAADHCAQTYTATTIATAAASGDTALTVDSITGISASDHLGVILDDGTLQWTTVNGAPSGSTVTAAAALTDDASAGNKVFAYTSKIVRPLKIVSARRYNLASGYETPLDPMMSREEYRDLPNKTQTGTINKAFYDPQLSTGYLNLWQPLSAITDLVNFTWWRPIEDFDAAGNNPDLPQEWIAALYWNLALELTARYPVSPTVYQRIAANAGRHLDNVSGFGREAESVLFAPDFEN